MKIIKWEYFFVFDDGERELMWDIVREKGKKLRHHETRELENHAIEKSRKDYPFVMLATFADGKQKEV
jgi:hypothetical protein